MALQEKVDRKARETYFVSPSLLKGRKARIYLNLHKPGLLSVQSVSGEDKGLVISHVRAIEMEDCQFRVSESGRQRVIRDQAKNVHAWVVGTVVDAASHEEEGRISSCMEQSKTRCIQVGYNPYFTKHFKNKDSGESLSGAERVFAVGKMVFAEGARILE